MMKEDRQGGGGGVLGTGGVLIGALLLAGGFSSLCGAEPLYINTVGGPTIRLEISHIGPGGSLVSPSATPAPAEFRPPSVFSAPVPSGSGARALGFGGAFTAIADDATAASWNPAGLVQLERPEASVVYRVTKNSQEHYSAADDFKVGTDDFDDEGVNYFSLAYPLRLKDRNIVFSINVQEAYNFNQRFTADLSQASGSSWGNSSSETYSETKNEYVGDEALDVVVTTHLNTLKTSTLQQQMASEALSSLEFDQQGVVDAVTPAMAFEVMPKLSVGAALNFYQAGAWGADDIRSTTRAKYSGSSRSSAHVVDEYYTTGSYTYDGVVHIPPGGGIPIAIDIPVSGRGTIAPFSDRSESGWSEEVYTEGEYEEVNEFNDFSGFNGTIGALWTVSRYVSVGCSLDLPWTASAEQKKTINNTVTTYDASHSRILDQDVSQEVETKDVEFDFPLYWSVGSVVRWTDRFYTALDLSQTKWSDFSYKADGEARLNPLDGTAYGENPLDDCWAVRTGMEYLWVLTRTEIPLRLGASWEERPAIGEPDEYWGVTAGTGISIGQDPGKMIIDFAYSVVWGDDVLGSLVPGQTGLKTDVVEEQFYVSSIWHF